MNKQKKEGKIKGDILKEGQKNNKKYNVLVINAGSFSLKYSIFSGLTLKKSGKFENLKDIKDYVISLKKIYYEISNDLTDIKDIDLIIHRVVHGGNLKKPCLINKKIKEKIKKFSDFAPLHNPIQLKIIEESERLFPNKKQYVIFDTMFFLNLPNIAKIYAIPAKISKKYDIRKYGFHGLSHENVSKEFNGKTIICHLGSGASISAIIDKKPIEISMGLTPLEGVVMGTRSGSIDPGIIFFLEKKGYDSEKILNKESGLFGISGYKDFRDILKSMNKDKNSKIAYDLFLYSIIKYIGSYITIMKGLDNLIFTGAIGENVPILRKDICDYLNYLNLKLDNNKNLKNENEISDNDSKIKVFIRKSNEQKFALISVLNLINETYKNKKSLV
jgi:acetate kinase